jgi:hypothetical protein
LKGGAGEELAVRYFAHIGPAKGSVYHRDRLDAIGVHDTPACDRMPIGMALAVGWDEQLRAVYRLIVRKADVPGRFILVDREFRLVE